MMLDFCRNNPRLDRLKDTRPFRSRDGEKTIMTTVPSTAASQRSFDDRGQAVRLTEDEIRQRNELALAALEAIEGIGDDAEQRETLDYLVRVVDEDRLSDRPRFGS
jgi:hypothetical protein